jgi:hypothetical protein
LVKEIKKRKNLNNRKVEDNRRQAAQKRSIEYPFQLKQVENNKKWKEFTNLKPGTKMTYKGRQYSEKNEHKLMKAIIAQIKSYNHEQERKRQKKMKAENVLEGIEGNIGNVSNKIDLVMAANTKRSQEINNNDYESCVDNNDIATKGALIMPNIDIEDNVEQERWDYTKKYNEWEGGKFSNNDKPKQNRMLENNFCNDRIRKDEVANILLSYKRKNKLDNSCNDEEEKSSEGENKGDKDDQFEANVNKSGPEGGEGNVCVYVGKMTEETLHATNASAEECGVDDCEGELEDNSKATININNHECNMIDDTEDNNSIIFKLEGNDVQFSLRDFGSYVKFNKECLHNGCKCGMVDKYLSAQLFAEPAVGQKRQKLKCMNKTGRFEKERLKENS